MSYYLGIDIGTYESKGVLVDADGTIAGTAARPHKMIVPRAGWAEHRAEEDWWGDFCAISRQLLADTGVAPGDVKAVATSAIGPCMLPIDAAGDPLMNAVLYGVDTRASAEIAELIGRYGEERLIETCGSSLSSQSVGPKILWCRNNRPDVYEKAAKFVTSTTFLVQRLTGRCVIDHYSASSFQPLYNVAEQAWDATLCEGICDPSALPDLAWTSEIAGEIKPAAAEATGLAAGTPVTVGTIDASAEAISVGVMRPGEMMVMYGSTIFIVMITEARVRDARLWYAPWLFEGGHACLSGLSTSGTLSHWFRDNFARELDPKDAFPALAAEAEASPPGARGLVVLPYFSGERTPIHDPHAKGVIFGLNLTHERADLYRALFEGIAYGAAHVIETYAAAGEDPVTLAAVGGGTRNRVWSQATSDVCGKPQVLRKQTIGASLGDGFLAALAVGDVAPEDIDRWNPVVGEITPDPANAEVYRRQYEVFKALYPQTKDLMAKLS